MKKIVSLIALLALFNANLAWSVGKIQNEDVKSVTDLTNAGSDQTHLINTDKIYDILNQQQLSASISSGALGGSGGSGGIELLSNTGFEGGTTGWTASGGTFTTINSGSNLIAGGKTASWVASASTQTLSSSAMVIKGLAGGQCSASMYYLYAGTAGDYTFQVVDGSSNVLASTSLGVQSLANTPTVLTFPCGGSTTSTLTWQIKSNVSSPLTIYVDTTHLGSLTVQQASQSQLLGTSSFSGCSSNQSTTNTGSFVNLSTGSGCSTPSVTGSVQAATTGVAGFNLSGGAGDYVIVVAATMGVQTANSGNNGYLRMSDGTTPSLGQVGYSANTAAGLSAGSAVFDIVETSAFTNKTFQIQGESGGGSLAVGVFGGPSVTFTVYYFPSTTTSTVNVGQQPQSWSGAFSGSNEWTTTSGTFADFGSQSNTFTQRTNVNFGTVTAASGNIPGFTFTPTTAATYWACASAAPTYSGAVFGALQLVDGSGSVVANIGSPSSATNGGSTVTLCGPYLAKSTSPVTLKLQGATNGGTMSLNFLGGVSSMVEFSIVNISASLGAAQFNGPGSITTTDTKAYHSEIAQISCHTGSCSISWQSGSWLASVSRSGAGVYNASFTSGEWGSHVGCLLTAGGCSAGNGLVGAQNFPTTSGLSNIVTSNTTGSIVDCDFTISCKGY